jgi:hypothetical protein
VLWTNNSESDVRITAHRCVIRDIVFNDGTLWPPKWRKTSLEEFYTGLQIIKSGGDHESFACLTVLPQQQYLPSLSGEKCIDMTVEVGYVLTDQPTDYQWKDRRFVKREPDPSWEPQLIDGTGDSCSDKAAPQNTLNLHNMIMQNPFAPMDLDHPITNWWSRLLISKLAGYIQRALLPEPPLTYLGWRTFAVHSQIVHDAGHERERRK